MIVITDYSIVSPLGWGNDANWQSILRETPTDSYKLNSDEYQVVDYMYDDLSENFKDMKSESVAVIVSNSKYNFGQSMPENKRFIDVSRLTDYFFAHNVSHYLATKIGSETLHLNVAGACATGLLSIIKGIDLLQRGIVDVVLAGSIETSKVPFIEAAFDRMRVLSHSGRIASFSSDRDGFIIGEGGGIFVLRRRSDVEEHQIKAVISGWDFVNDAYDAIAFDPEGISILKVISGCFEAASVDRADYINAHGTGTRLNDEIESVVFKKLPDIPFSSTKPYTGHLLGAAGAVELGLCLLSMENKWMIPNLNCDNVMDESLNIIKKGYQNEAFHSFLTLNYGFGGHIAALLVKAFR